MTREEDWKEARHRTYLYLADMLQKMPMEELAPGMVDAMRIRTKRINEPNEGRTLLVGVVIEKTPPAAFNPEEHPPSEMADSWEGDA